YKQLLNTEISNYSYERGEIPDAEYVMVSFDIITSAVEMEQVCLIFFFDGKAVTVTFTNVSGDYVEDFVAGISTFHVVD
ncbi:MAG: hypothetical protein IKY02_00850, partial [Lachnospiraceae bacterium]|nr:hypothetical protein [Lachnospiraceae bacterium]